MPIDWDAIERAGGIGKGRSRADLKEARLRLRKQQDEKENAKARKRAKGRCEIWIDGVRCSNPDTQTHHMKGGNGTRARGDSILAERKQRCCWECHRLVQHKTKVIRLGGAEPHWRDRYQRKPVYRLPSGS